MTLREQIFCMNLIPNLILLDVLDEIEYNHLWMQTKLTLDFDWYMLAQYLNK